MNKCDSNMENLSFASQSESLLVALSGPGGVGKSTIINRWLKENPNLVYIKNYTTRLRRPRNDFTEIDDEYFFKFVSCREFKRLVVNGEFAQWCNPSSGYYSGTPLKPIREAIKNNKDVILDYTPQLFMNFRRVFRHNTIGIFVAPPTMAELRRRLENRGGEQGEKLEMKYQMGVQDLNFIDEHEYIVVNHDVDETLKKIKCIYIAEKSRISRQVEDISKKHRPTASSMLFYYDPMKQRVKLIADGDND